MLLYNFAFWSTFFLAVNGLPNEFPYRIAYGEQSPIETRPYMASFTYIGHNFKCAGSIISKNLILTAAHCVWENTGYIRIRAGSNYRFNDGSEHIIVSAIRHENYKIFKDKGRTINDVGIVKVEPSFYFDETRQPISLFNAGERILPGSSGIVSGWGHVPYKQREKLGITATDHFNIALQSVVIPIWEKSVCDNMYKKRINYTLEPGQMCAGAIEKRSCEGDSGGPLVVDNRVAGLVSWGFPCHKEGVFPPTVYTKVAHYRNWIDEQVCKLNNNRTKFCGQANMISSNQFVYHHGQNHYHSQPIWT